MKTAMQELIELLELAPKNEALPYLIDVIKEVYIQKEKEQIMKTARQCHFEGVRQYAKTSEEYIAYGEQYYNETYSKQEKL